jgi:predicted AlkP superfamily phosphohydrolase/phosphomutase
MTGAKLLILGLDAIPPRALFEMYREETPNIQELARSGIHGALRSSDPPLTMPAWPVMFTGVDAGTLGLYGFTSRPGFQYDSRLIPPNPRTLRRPTVWEILSRHGRTVCVLGVPPGYPPPTVNGVYVSDFATPFGASDFVSPKTYAPRIRRWVGGNYPFDTPHLFHQPVELERNLLAMLEAHFITARELLAERTWDVLALHEIGPDRLHHPYWHILDPDSPDFDATSEVCGMGRRYYRRLDEIIGQLVACAGPSADVLIVSDHGFQPLKGLFALNEWLRREGYLKLHAPVPTTVTPLERCSVDWTKSQAWAAPGIHSRIYLNLKGREPKGIVPPSHADNVLQEIRDGLERLRDQSGRALPVQVYRPRELYTETNGEPPDLIAYFDSLRWSTNGDVGGPTLFPPLGRGPFEMPSTHSLEGVYIYTRRSSREGLGAASTRSILDVAPTVLESAGVPIPSTLQGRPFSR